MAVGIDISDAVLREVCDEAILRYPDEACGFLLGLGGQVKKFMACRNVQNELHESNPERFPRDAKTAYVISAEDQKRIESEAKQQGWDILAIVHSHPEHDAYFSAEDKTNAAPWGEPLFPGLSYVVVSVYDRKIKAMNEYFWDEQKKDFVERKIS